MKTTRGHSRGRNAHKLPLARVISGALLVSGLGGVLVILAIALVLPTLVETGVDWKMSEGLLASGALNQLAVDLRIKRTAVLRALPGVALLRVGLPVGDVLV